MLDKEKVLSELEIDEASLNAIPETVVKKKTELVGYFAINETVKLDDGEFSLKFIESDGNETLIYINPDDHGKIAIHRNEKFKVQLEEKNEKLYVKKLSPRKPANSTEKKEQAEKIENITKIRNFLDPEGPFPIPGVRDKGLLVELVIEGVAHQIVDEDSTSKFVLSTDKTNFDCVIINTLKLEYVPLKLKENTSYMFRGYLAGDGYFYITEAIGEYAIDPIYNNIPSNLVGEFRQLSLCQKNEILNIYEYYTHPEKKVEVLPSLSFFSLDEYVIKYKLIREFIPKSISTIIEKKIHDQANKNRHKFDILKTLLDTLYPPTREKTDIEESMTKFRNNYFGHEREARRIFKLLNNNNGGCYCLVGESTDFFLKSSLDACGIKYTRIDANTVENLIGTPNFYDNATLGELIKNISTMQTIVIPNIDKITSENRNMDPLTPIIQILNSGVLIDSMVGEPLNLFDLNIKVFVTFSDVSKFSKKLLSKMNTIYLPDFSEDERRTICEKYMIPEKLKALPNGTEVHFENDVYDKIANQFTTQNGLFEIEANLTKIFDAIGDQTHTEISSENLVDFLGIKKWKNNEYAKELLSLKEKFMCHKPSYEEERARYISKLFEFYDEATTLERREELLNQLRILVNILPSDHFSNLELEDIERRMNETHFNMTKAKKHILNSLTLRKCSSTAKIKPLLLYGSYGVGKTSIATSFSECPTIFIPCQGMTRQKLTRDIATKLSEACTSNAVVILEELDKVSKGYENPIHVVQSIIDGLLSLDNMTCNIDVSGLLVIATTNNLEEISPALLSRFDLIKIEGYSLSEKKIITENFLLPKLKKTFNIEELKFTETAIDEVLQYSTDVGMREIKKNITEIIGVLLRKNQKVTKVTEEHVKEVLGEKPLKSLSIEDSSCAGVVNGMAVCNNKGFLMPIVVSENTFGDGDEIVGLAGEMVKESVKIAKLLCEKLLNKKLSKLFIEFSETSIKKQGTSAGAAIFVAILSFALQQPVPSDYAFTGELSTLDGGKILPVAVREKLKAASDQKTSRVYVPYDNYVQEAGNLQKYNVEIVPIKNVKELINELFDLGGELNDK